MIPTGPIDAPLPADLRSAPRETQDRYRAAAGFEQMLVAQLTKTLSATAGGDAGASAATGTYRAMLPDVLAQSITAAGGLGLARSIAGLEEERGA